VNLVLSFVHPRKQARSVGPFHGIRIDTKSIRDLPADKLVARMTNHQWEVEGESFFRLDASSRVRIHFERDVITAKSRPFGPYGNFSTVDGIAYVENRVFAFVDGKVGDWFCYDDGRYWAVMIVTDATRENEDKVLGAIALAPLVPGVIALWQGVNLFYLGHAQSIRARLGELVQRFGPDAFNALTWEAHSNPAAREAELLAEYRSGARTLPQTYGRQLGNRVRSSRLIARAAEMMAVARAICDDVARNLEGIQARRGSPA
jgi:hypothetical protein